MQLNEDANDHSGKIIKFTPGTRNCRKRLFAVGVLPDTEFKFQKRVPIGDPKELSGRGSILILTKSEAAV